MKKKHTENSIQLWRMGVCCYISTQQLGAATISASIGESTHSAYFNIILEKHNAGLLVGMMYKFSRASKVASLFICDGATKMSEACNAHQFLEHIITPMCIEKSEECALLNVHVGCILSTLLHEWEWTSFRPSSTSNIWSYRHEGHPTLKIEWKLWPTRHHHPSRRTCWAS